MGGTLSGGLVQMPFGVGPTGCSQSYQNAHQTSGGYTLGNVTVSTGATYGHLHQHVYGDYQSAVLQYHQAAQQEQKRMSGNKPIVVCGGETKEAKDMDDAQQIAESLAHSKSADAYILKPVKKVAPKRDVVTTDLA